jgi:hypothetical protein
VRRVLTCAVLLAALSAPVASAADPITPLRDIHRGLRCTALTVVQGTDISSFDVDVLDVVSEVDGSGARILVRVSGPAVASTGIAQGFSGSPVYCPDASGAIGNAGAIAATIGQFGNDVGLVTPIEQMLSLPVRPPSGVRHAPRLLRAARSVAGPLVISGLAPSLGRLVERAGRRGERAIVAAPAGPLATFAPQPLVPGASLAVGLSTGAIAASGVGTVTYRDGDTVYGFGHPFDNAGRRALLLQDAYVFTVVGNPLDVGDATSYKLAAPGHTLGTLTNDAPAGVVGALGAPPPTVPLTVTVRDLDRGTAIRERTDIVDEVDLGDPAGRGALPGIASLAVAQAVTTAFDGAPAQETGTLCLTARVRELRRPLRICNRHVAQGALNPGLPIPLAVVMGAEVASALSNVSSARFAALHLTRIDAAATVERGLRLATIRAARVSRRVVRPGQRVRVALRVRLLRGPLRTLRFRLRIPRDTPPGPRTLQLAGTPVEDLRGLDEDILSFLTDLFSQGMGPGAQTMREVVRRVERLEYYDGIRVRLGRDRWRAYRHPRLRIDGRARIDLIVAGKRRGGDALPPELRKLLESLG